MDIETNNNRREVKDLFYTIYNKVMGILALMLSNWTEVKNSMFWITWDCERQIAKINCRL